MSQTEDSVAENVRFAPAASVDAARAKLSAPFETQDQQRCLQHAFNNAWRNRLALDGKAPAPRFGGWLEFTAAEASRPQELQRLDRVIAPDGFAMKQVRLFPEQLRGLMPALRAHLDLAVIYTGPTNVSYQPAQPTAAKHFVGLIQVDGLHFELESLGGDEHTQKRPISDLQAYFERLPGGVWMAVPGDPGHPLARYLQALAQERFCRSVEALALLTGDAQPITALVEHMWQHPLAPEAVLDADYLAAFCRTQYPGRQVASAPLTGVGSARTAAVITALDAAGVQQAILLTGTDPLALVAVREASGTWCARLLARKGELQQQVERPLKTVLDEQERLFKAKSADEARQLRAYAEILTLEPRQEPDATAAPRAGSENGH
jgi:hypothetical protein